MAISYRKRGKNKTWDYRIFDKNKKVIASNSGFKTKKEAILEAAAEDTPARRRNTESGDR